MPRKAHEPTEKTRNEVQALAGFGVREDEIALYIGIDPKTLRKYYRPELDTGHIKANVNVARNLYKQTEKNPTAAIFWLRSRASWSDKSELEIEIKRLQIEKLKAEINVVKKTGRINGHNDWTDDELEARIRELERQNSDELSL